MAINELTLLQALEDTLTSISGIRVEDARSKLKHNQNGAKYRIRDVSKLKGMVFHQALGHSSVEEIAEYHTGKASHLTDGGVESVAYTLLIRRNGNIVLANDLNKATWSQGDKARDGDENQEFIAVCFEGFYSYDGIPTTQTKDVDKLTGNQLYSALTLWNLFKRIYGWSDLAIYGHYHFGKPACPGNDFKHIIEMIRKGSRAIVIESIAEIQHVLVTAGYLSHITSKMDLATKTAVRSFQAAHKLTVDGIVGPQTLSKMQQIASKGL